MAALRARAGVRAVRTAQGPARNEEERGHRIPAQEREAGGKAKKPSLERGLSTFFPAGWPGKLCAEPLFEAMHARVQKAPPMLVA